MNNENVFEREMNLCQDFKFEEEKKNHNLIISFNVSNGEVTIWATFDKVWDVDKGVKVLNDLVVRRKLNMIGYQNPWTALAYSTADWDKRKRICEYTCICPNLDIKIFFDCVDYSDFGSSHVDY